MRTINLNELKQIEFNLLCEFDKICKEQGLNYSLCGGTLLGAIRHKGFIPWDDDIDVLMPRHDYERFFDYCVKNDVIFDVVTNKFDENYNYLFSKVCAKNTKIIENNNDLRATGVYIDVFPLDGLGNTSKQAKLNYSLTAVGREVLVASDWKKYKRSLTHAWYIEPIRLIMFAISRLINPHKLSIFLDKLCSRVNYENSIYAAVICGSYRTREIMPKSVFDSFVEHDFENRKFSVICGYETYLKNLYGDYMKLPPEEKRVTHHTFEAYYID